MADREHLKKLDDLDERVEKAIGTTDFQHRNAFMSAEGDVLKDENGEIDYEKLRDPKIQEKFADKMADAYLEAAREHFKVGETEAGNPIYEDTLLHGYAGITRNELRKQVAEAKDKFTFELFNKEIKPELMKRIREALRSTSSGHLSDEHKADLISAGNLGEYVNPDALNLEQTVGAYRLVRENKGVSKAVLERLPNYALTDKAKKEFDIGDRPYMKEAA